MRDQIRTKAADLLAGYIAGNVHPRRLRQGRRPYLCLNVDIRHRLVCLKPEHSKDPNYWQLLTHERYNSVMGKLH